MAAGMGGAPDRTQPLLPMRPGQIERRTRDYKRHGTASLFAALDVKAGTIVGQCTRRHRTGEFRRFLDEVEKNVPADLDTHIVMDKSMVSRPSTPLCKTGVGSKPTTGGTHKTRLIRDWF